LDANAFLFYVNSSYFPSNIEKRPKEDFVSLLENEFNSRQIKHESNEKNQEILHIDPDFLRDLKSLSNAYKTPAELKGK